MDLIETSLQIALNAYKDKKDKAGEAYILHPLRLMAKMETIEEKTVALLHDVVEDSDYTADYLKSEGIPSNIVDAVLALTKNEGEDYESFIERVLTNKLAIKVKIADIEDNINVLRLKSISNTDLQRVEKYHRSWQKLKNAE